MSHQPIRAYRISKVELAVCDVGLRDSDGVLFVGAGVEVKGMDEHSVIKYYCAQSIAPDTGVRESTFWQLNQLLTLDTSDSPDRV
ncbi:hypothetical protein Tco_1093659 [Tanacetum coccineum]|uniref:Uncharacterized protein n=1 Tax=Tanacetum coccineum TaxID=301880 RepID=A0ABQ5IEJ1_9ASTR